MNTIYVEPEQLANASQDIRLIKGDLANIMNDIETLVLSSNGAWQGDAEVAFASRIVFVKRQFSEIAQFFEDYAELIRGFAYSYEQLESDITSKIQFT